MTRKQLGVPPSGVTDQATKGYVDTYIRSVLKSVAANNMVVDSDFSSAASWANAFGVMDTSQYWSGLQSRRLTATGGGTTVDRLWITHDGTGTQLKLPADSNAGTPNQLYVDLRFRIRRNSANTGTTANAVRYGVYWYDDAGTETYVETATSNETAISSSGWNQIDWNISIPTAATTFSVAITIDGAVPVGNIYYIDSVYLIDTTILASWVSLKNKAITSCTINVASNTVTSLPWCPEMVCTSAAVADGYNDMPGGICVEPGPISNGVLIDTVYVRLGTIGSVIAGGTLGVDVYLGTNAAQGTNIASFSMTTGIASITSTLGTPAAAAANAVIRVYFTKGSCTNTDPIHVQLRGRYA